MRNKYKTGYDSNQDSENCYYKELNSRTVNKVFKKFRLSGMYCGKNDLVEFLITPTIVSSLRDTYLYGFY